MILYTDELGIELIKSHNTHGVYVWEKDSEWHSDVIANGETKLVVFFI